MIWCGTEIASVSVRLDGIGCDVDHETPVFATQLAHLYGDWSVATDLFRALRQPESDSSWGH